MHNCIEKIVFPQMVIEKELKTSDRGCVYLVRDKETHARYIYRAFAGNGEVYRRMYGIDCPHLPTIHDVKEESGMVYVLEEYVQGDTLAFLLVGKPLTAAHAKQIMIQVCYALHILHGIGAIHRDIKPENIIMRGSDAVLIDFDASRLCKSTNTTDTQIMGTTGYAAPEQYGFSQTDARTDIYALGILLNEMLTGLHPSKQLADGEFRPIIQKCTQINADQRYSSVMELIAALNIPPQKRKPVIRVLFVLFAAAILLWGGRLLHRNRPQEETQKLPKMHEEAVIQTEPQTAPHINNPTKTPTQPPAEPVSIGQWEGATDGFGTTFYHDLDGDGIQETYLFGVDFLASPHENVVYYERCAFNIGEGHKREIHCCVWQVNSDGTMNVAEGFTELLSDTEANIWKIDLWGDALPVAMQANYKWPGAISVTFYPENAGSYMYEVVSYMNDQKLTAQATFTYVLRDSFS